MKCRKCGDKAAIHMRQHKLPLCKTHFLDWIPLQTQRMIEKHNMFSREERILVAVSGGKDSLALWDILLRLGYQADGLYIGLGIDEGIGYSEESRQLSEDFANRHSLKLHIVNVQEEYGATIPEIAKTTNRGRGKPCSVCGLTKRHIMNRAAKDGGYDVLATGHNLDDEAAVLFGNTLNWLGEYLTRQGPVLDASGGLVRKVKPLYRFYEREMAAYALARQIEYIHEECPFSVGAKTITYKNFLNQLESDNPGTKLIFYLNFLKEKEKGLFAPRKIEQTTPPNTCQSCRQPTFGEKFCGFCGLIQEAAASNTNDLSDL